MYDLNCEIDFFTYSNVLTPKNIEKNHINGNCIIWTPSIDIFQLCGRYICTTQVIASNLCKGKFENVTMYFVSNCQMNVYKTKLFVSCEFTGIPSHQKVICRYVRLMSNQFI